MKALSRGSIVMLWPLLVGLMFGAEQPKRSTLPAVSNVESRSLKENGRKVTERVVTTTIQEEPSEPKIYKAAIFVSSRAGCEDVQLGAVEDMVIAGVTEQGLRVIARETASNAVSGLDPVPAVQDLDQVLSNSTSAVRLAQNLGADVVLQVTVTSYDKKKNRVEAYGVKLNNEERTLRLTYKLLDGVSGASLAADTVSARRAMQATATADEENTGVLSDLIEEASRKVASSVKRRLDDNRLAGASSAQNLVTVTITTEAADLMIPDVRIGAENTVAISESKFKVSPLSVTVEIDGMAAGSAPGTLQVRPGLSKLRLTREGFTPWERTVNFTSGMNLNVAMQMSDAGYARWQESTAFINVLKNGAKLTDAEVKVLEGQAKMLEQSGFKINVNTKEGITIRKQQSLFSN